MGADLDALDRLIADAEAAMLAATGGGAVCAITRSGGSAPAAKYHEGRWAALRTVRSVLRGRPGAGPIVVERELAAWQADLDRRRQAGAGADWIAYLTGGLDALTGLRDGA